MRSPTEAIERLAAEIGEVAYLDIAKWHLYLANAHLHVPLAEQVYPLLQAGTLDRPALVQVLTAIPVPLGGGKRSLPLIDLIPEAAVNQLLESLLDLARDLD